VLLAQSVNRIRTQVLVQAGKGPGAQGVDKAALVWLARHRFGCASENTHIG